MKPIPKAPFLPSARVRIQHFGQRHEAGPRIYLFADVLDELTRQAAWRPDPCVCLLTGGFYDGPAGPYIEIQGFAEAAWLEHTREAQGVFKRRYKALRETLARDSPEQRVVGWFHGLPGCGGQPDPEVLLVHMTWFNLPFQVCMLLDPQDERLGFFHRGPDGALHNVGFKLIALSQEAVTNPETVLTGLLPATTPDPEADSPGLQATATGADEAAETPTHEATPEAAPDLPGDTHEQDR